MLLYRGQSLGITHKHKHKMSKQVNALSTLNVTMLIFLIDLISHLWQTREVPTPISSIVTQL